MASIYHFSSCKQSALAPQKSIFRDISSQGVGAKPLDLINGHLTEFSHHAVSRGSDLFPAPKNWFIPHDFDRSNENPMVAKVQPFASGGYEVTITCQNLPRLAAASDIQRNTGKREKGEQSEDDVKSSLNRSRRRIRHLIKSMGCDRLLTLTMRENDPDNYKNLDDWQKAWDCFNRLCKRAGVPIDYVAVLEKHKKGNYHLHAAICGRINIKLIRRLWFISLGGKGCESGSFTPGNIDLSFKQGVSEHKRRAGCAKYVSKYVAKQAGYVEFNKKRYWSSRHKMPAVRRYILKATDAKQALFDVSNMFALRGFALIERAFIFGAGVGAWFSYDDDLAAVPPF